MRERSLDGRRVLLTGAAHGIGAATTARLVRTGATVVAFDRDGDALDRLASHLGTAVRPVTGDVRDVAALQSAVDTLDGRVDALVVNAAHAEAAAVIDDPQAASEEIVDVGLFGAWRTLRVVTPALRRPGGRIVVVTSTAVAVRPQLYGPYAASKAGLEALVDPLRLELAGEGISVGALTFHAVDTPTYQRVIGDARLAPLRRGMPSAAFRAVPVGQAADAVVRAIASSRRRSVTPWWAAPVLIAPGTAQRTFEVVGRLTGATRLPRRRVR